MVRPRMRAQVEADEERNLAPYALRASRSRGRRSPEPDDPHRTAFARDRDRIVHSGAFRRLEYKTQVLISGTGDNYRSRMTHTLEVTQIARSLAQILRLNETLVEALALAHDLGHPPFGHSGEAELRDLMRDAGGFEHNVQALRVVDLLENPYPDRPGLNLTHEVRESMLKHGLEKAGALARGFVERPQPWLEAQLVDLADSVGYTAHDIDDGLRFGVLTEDQLDELGLWRRARTDARRRYPAAAPAQLLRPTVHQVLQAQILDVVEHSERAIAGTDITRAEDARELPERLVRFSPEMRELQAEARRYLFAHFYRASEVEEKRGEARALLRELFEYLLAHDEELPERARTQGEADPGGAGRARAVCDYLAGMTDRFAQSEHRRLLRPRP